MALTWGVGDHHGRSNGEQVRNAPFPREADVIKETGLREGQ